jgi:hypothetical protein
MRISLALVGWVADGKIGFQKPNCRFESKEKNPFY